MRPTIFVVLFVALTPITISWRAVQGLVLLDLLGAETAANSIEALELRKAQDLQDRVNEWVQEYPSSDDKATSEIMLTQQARKLVNAILYNLHEEDDRPTRAERALKLANAACQVDPLVCGVFKEVHEKILNEITCAQATGNSPDRVGLGAVAFKLMCKQKLLALKKRNLRGAH